MGAEEVGAAVAVGEFLEVVEGGEDGGEVCVVGFLVGGEARCEGGGGLVCVVVWECGRKYEPL